MYRTVADGSVPVELMLVARNCAGRVVFELARPSSCNTCSQPVVANVASMGGEPSVVVLLPSQPSSVGKVFGFQLKCKISLSTENFFVPFHPSQACPSTWRWTNST